MLALDLDAPDARRDLLALATRLADALDRIDPALARTRCHGDCHGMNARIATAGPFAGQAVFFDFDDGEFGYLAYDLAVHLWAQVSFGRQRLAMWHAFRAGYKSVRPVAPADEAAVLIFVPHPAHLADRRICRPHGGVGHGSPPRRVAEARSGFHAGLGAQQAIAHPAVIISSGSRRHVLRRAARL